MSLLRHVQRNDPKPRHSPPGSSPGMLITPENALPSVMHVIAYSPDAIIEKTIERTDEISVLLTEWPVVWINIDGLGSKNIIEKLREMFNLHPLALEDVMNAYQRPKAEEYGETAFLIMHMARLSEKRLIIEQMSVFMGRNFVLTFQDKPGDCLNPLRERLRRGAGRQIRSAGTDYLTYCLIDSVVDSYFPVLEYYGDWIDRIEDEVIFKPVRATIERIHLIKRKLNRLRHAIWPMREMISNFSTRIHGVTDQTRLYVRDCADHQMQILDLMETDRERASSLIDIYLSSISNRMNEIMKVLTIITTIFIPLSFIAGIYGMNFDTSSPWNMPELHWRYGYPAVLAVMALIVAGLLIYFQKRGWIGKSGP